MERYGVSLVLSPNGGKYGPEQLRILTFFTQCSVLNFMFLTTSLSTTSLNCFNSTGTVFNIITFKSSIFAFKLFKLVGALNNLLMSSLATSAKSFLAAKSDSLTSVTCFNSFDFLSNVTIWF